MARLLEKILGQEKTITVVGNHVWDNYWTLDLKNPKRSFSLIGTSTIDDIISIGNDGSFTFRLPNERGGDDIAREIALGLNFEKTYYFFCIRGNPDRKPGEEAWKVYPGDKRKVLAQTGSTIALKLVMPHISHVHPGGGAYNLLEAASNALKFNFHYIGPAFSEERDYSEHKFEEHLKRIGVRATILHYLKGPQVNIVIPQIIGKDGKAILKNRAILIGYSVEGSFDDHTGKETIDVKPGTVIIDSLKDYHLGREVITKSVAHGNLGIMAMTPSMPKELKDLAFKNGFIPILSDDDIEGYYLNHYGQALVLRDKKTKEVNYRNVVNALEWIRQEQLRHKDGAGLKRIYITLGDQGSVCLDEHGTVHRLGVYSLPSDKVNDTNGAGDSYAAGIAAAEHFSRFYHNGNWKPTKVMQCAAAFASAKILQGTVNPKTVDEMLRREEKYQICLASENPLEFYQHGGNFQRLEVRYCTNPRNPTSLKKMFGGFSR